ncbi:23S rRNA (adenine(2030)-N(6))-methyltransferase RlmJ [Yoonia sp. 208BN28-4]|uniref:23S rRNA (adenine(2030)-N(6))-methyltransferase RlmJ n=1 Tax=Yoonia sp. 208BN28-4 TaxID=3126505 RepID=UPI0030A79805
MLSYQHAYHAGNMADVHKHGALAWALDYMTKKPKPLTYLETHAGRALYDLGGTEAAKTGEAAQGVALIDGWFPADHPYLRALAAVQVAHGPDAYPGSPLVAAQVLRSTDPLYLSELHPQEHAALTAVMKPHGAICDQRDGWEMALSRCPPDPRRGFLLIDPSFEVKSDYQSIPDTIAKLHRKWPVGVIMLWYPILTSGAHAPMTAALCRAIPDGLLHEVAFPPAREGHGMTGSGLFVVNPPYGLSDELARLKAKFATRAPQPKEV